MQDKLGKTLENLFKPTINSLKFGKITLGCYITSQHGSNHGVNDLSTKS
jgi:hypothetical protein